MKRERLVWILAAVIWLFGTGALWLVFNSRIFANDDLQAFFVYALNAVLFLYPLAIVPIKEFVDVRLVAGYSEE